MPYPTIPYLSYPILPLPHSHPTPTKHILNSLTKHIPYPPYPTLPCNALTCRDLSHPTPPHPSTPHPTHTTTPRAPTTPPGVTFGHSELLGQFRESTWFTEMAEEFWTSRPIPWINLIHGNGRGVPNALLVFHSELLGQFLESGLGCNTQYSMLT